jgi:hypothetical protein
MECLTIFFALLSMILAHGIRGKKEIKYEAGFYLL